MPTAVELYQKGFTGLVSVIPPDAELSPYSDIKVTADKDPRGKSPGIPGQHGWHGYNWRESTSTIEDAKRMDDSGANIGLSASLFPAIDVDVLDHTLAKLISDVIEELIPTGPVRIGQAPKRLYMFRLPADAEQFRKMQLVMEHNGQRQLVEILGAGQQYVIAGKHSKTKKPYTWPVPLTDAAELPTLTKETAEAVLRAIEIMVCEVLNLPYHRSGAGDLRSGVIQEDLLCPDVAELAAAVKLIPNTDEHFPTREGYIRMGHAIKAATAADPHAGLEIFLEWALRYESNTPEQIESAWNSFSSPW
jgi:hypothetical protein